MSELSRLRWRCRRGMLELDILLGNFLDGAYQAESGEVKRAFEELLTYQDQHLQDLLFGDEQAEEARIADVIQRIKNHPPLP